MYKKILITAGGTGGHTYPAQGLAQQLKKDAKQCEILFVAGGLAANRYFDREEFSYKEVACKPLISKNPLKIVKGLISLFKGVYQSVKIIKEFKPNVVVGFGSFYTVPILLAAKILKIPILLHEANSIPGKANKWFSPYAQCTGILFPSTVYGLRGPSEEVGLPLREGYKAALISKQEARTYFQLDEKVLTLLIFGGSQGAQAINQAITDLFSSGFNEAIQIIHLTGNEQKVNALKELYKSNGINACVKAFENKMNLAWAAADIFIGRSGASTIAEAIEFEVPGILIPFPYATENHQEKNAEFLVNEVKGAYMLPEKKLTSDLLKATLNTLLKNMSEMRKAINKYKNKPNRIDFSTLVLNYVDRKKGYSK